MTRTARFATAAVAALALTAVATAGPAVARADAAPGADGSPAGQLTRIADEALAAGVPGVLVRVDDGRGPVVSFARQGVGTADDHRLRATDTFRMGSNTKTVTAVLVLQLVAEHRLRLTDPIEKWLPGAVPGGADITVRMLLNHTGGLADYAYTRTALDLMTGNRKQIPTAEEMLALGTALPPVGAPGEKYSYSNTGYVALGLVLEKVTGRSLADLVQQRIARPLGLTDTYLATNAVPGKRTNPLAHGYEPDSAHLAPLLEPLGLPAGYGFVGPVDDEQVDVTALDQSWNSAAGAVVSTTRDWATFDTALMSGRLIPRRLLTEMRETVPTELADRRYGLGLEEYRSPCGAVWGHDGALPGYRSDNYTDRSGRRTVSVLSTTHFGLTVSPEASAAETRLVDAAICTMLGKPVPTS